MCPNRASDSLCDHLACVTIADDIDSVQQILVSMGYGFSAAQVMQVKSRGRATSQPAPVVIGSVEHGSSALAIMASLNDSGVMPIRSALVRAADKRFGQAVLPTTARKEIINFADVSAMPLRTEFIVQEFRNSLLVKNDKNEVVNSVNVRDFLVMHKDTTRQHLEPYLNAANTIDRLTALLTEGLNCYVKYTGNRWALLTYPKRYCRRC